MNVRHQWLVVGCHKRLGGGVLTYRWVERWGWSTATLGLAGGSTGGRHSRRRWR